jgi:flagella basal body P-ring formation protein FlgA
MKLRTILLIAAAWGCALAAPTALAGTTDQVVLRQSITVDDNLVKLGDLFIGAGDHAAVGVAYAPAPGKRAIFDSQWLYRVANAYGLAWRPMSLQDQAVVQRASTVIGRDEIEGRILDALTGNGIGPDAQVELSNHAFRVYVAEGANTLIDVEDMVFDPRTRRFTTVIAVTPDGAGTQRFRLAGRVYDVRDVPVLTRRILPGEIIAAGDIDTVPARTGQMRRDTIVDAENLIGKSPKRALPQGRPIAMNEVQAPVLVPNRGLVTILYQRPRMTLTAKGRAMQDGADGDVIRISNVQSNTVIEAVVVGPHTVAVTAQDRTLTN